jgi:hypothetical protein
MTRNEIIEMARKAGSLIEIAQEKDLLWLTAFAKLVAQHEREACAKLLEDTADGAKKVDPKGFVWQAIQKSAEFIRARGQE